MKYLENLDLEQLTNLITEKELGGGRKINGRIETYSTKRAGEDKRHSKILEQKFEDIYPSSGPGDTMTKTTRKLLVDLIQTLNASMVDFDFSQLSPDSFDQVELNDAVATVNSRLAELTTENVTFLTNLWRLVDESICLSQCEVFILTDDPLLDCVSGVLWAFNYFFYNKDLKRICYFACLSSASPMNPIFGAASGMGSDDDDDYCISNINNIRSEDDEDSDEMDASSQEY